MRLIDADKVKEHIIKEGFYCDTKADKEATAKEIDSLFPTVEAIPIEWIKEWYKKHVIYLDENKPTGKGLYAYEQMIYDWGKEK